ncbi:MAG: M3 family metallopeptidase [Hyphomicrobiaceae bacterium]
MTTSALIEPWTTPYGLPPFGAIAIADFRDAFEAAMTQHRREIDMIAASEDPPSFDNTIAALERAGAQLDRVAATFYNLASAATSQALQEIERELAPKMAAHSNAITSNTALFARINALYRSRESLRLTDEQTRVLERTHLGFVRAGASLEEADKERLGIIKQRLSELGTAFSQNVLADEAAFELPLEAPRDLEGLPDFLIAAAEAAAVERGSSASHVITLSRSLIEPFLMFCPNRALRERAFKAWVSRGANSNEHDNRALVAEMLALRQDRARLLGFENFAAYKLDTTMAETPARVRDLLVRVWQPALARALEERDALAEYARSEGANIEIEPWDWRYWAERVRKARYDIDEVEVKPYFTLDSMIEAAFYTAHRLFGLTFVEHHGLALYHPDVRAWDVRDASGQHVGLFLGDYFNRASKRSGAWMSAYRGQRNLDGRVRPIIVNVCNFAKAQPGKPTLLSFDDARTLFHEFGHALHGLLSDVTYPSLAGTSVARDFVELPSQLFEHWLETDDVLDRFARHAETGKPLPAALKQKIIAARRFNQGFATLEYLASALVDLAFHEHAHTPDMDPMTFQARVLTEIGMPREIVMRHATPHFLHVFAGDGYSAGYYSYLWSEVLDADAFAAFEETGDVFHAETAERLRRYIYAAGGVRKEQQAYEAFRGQLPGIEGLMKKRGFA